MNGSSCDGNGRLAAGSKHRRGSLQHSVRRVAVVSCLWPGTGETRSAVSANFRGGALSPWRRPQSSVAPSNIKAKQQFLPQILLAPSETEILRRSPSFTLAPFAIFVSVVAPCTHAFSTCSILHLVVVAVAAPSRYPRSL